MKKDRSTKETCDFIVYSVLAFGIIYMFYFYSFFLPYADQLRFSGVKAYNIITLTSFVCCLVAFRRQRHTVTMAVSAAFPFSFFTLLNMSSVFRGYIRFAILLIVAIVGVWVLMIRKGYIISSVNGKKLNKETLKRSIIAAQMVFTLLMSFCVMATAVNNVIDIQKRSKAIAASEEQQTMEEIKTYDLSEYTIDNFSKELEGFSDKRWSGFSNEEKISLLQIVANIEANNMGIAPFTVKSDDLGSRGKDAYTTGCYEAKDNTIYIDTDYLNTESSYFILQTIGHECYHGWQHALLKLYYEASPESRKMRIFADISEYIENILSYDEALKNFDQYYNLKLESMARAYGEDRAKDYYLLGLRIDPSNKDHFDFPEEKDKRFHYDYEEENYKEA